MKLQNSINQYTCKMHDFFIVETYKCFSNNTVFFISFFTFELKKWLYILHVKSLNLGSQNLSPVDSRIEFWVWGSSRFPDFLSMNIQSF